MSSSAREYSLNGQPYDQGIEPKVVVLHVVEVALELGHRALHRPSVAQVDLCPPGHSGPDAVSGGVVRKFLRQPRRDRYLLGPWPDQGEIAADDVPQLGQLIEAETPHKLSHRCYPVSV